MKIRLVNEENVILVEIESGTSILDAINVIEKIETYTINSKEYIREDNKVYYNHDEQIVTIFVKEV